MERPRRSYSSFDLVLIRAQLKHESREPNLRCVPPEHCGVVWIAVSVCSRQSSQLYAWRWTLLTATAQQSYVDQYSIRNTEFGVFSRK
jgi:hypothetical protein